MGINKAVIGTRRLLQSVCAWEQNLFGEEALDNLNRHDSRRTAVAREHNYCFDRKILVGSPILLVLVSVYKMC